MNRLTSTVVCMAILALATLLPARSEARVFVGIGVGGCCYYGPGWGYPYYPGYYYPPYYQPPVAYTPPPVVPYTMPASMMADQTSPTFVDSFGRTCRQFQASGTGSVSGTACMQTDGTWRVVQ